MPPGPIRIQQNRSVKRFSPSWLLKSFYFLFSLTAIVYVLRGLAILSMLPGLILWLLLLLSIATGILATLQSLQRRY